MQGECNGPSSDSLSVVRGGCQCRIARNCVCRASSGPIQTAPHTACAAGKSPAARPNLGSAADRSGTATPRRGLRFKYQAISPQLRSTRVRRTKYGRSPSWPCYGHDGANSYRSDSCGCHPRVRQELFDSGSRHCWSDRLRFALWESQLLDGSKTSEAAPQIRTGAESVGNLARSAARNSRFDRLALPHHQSQSAGA